MSTVYVIQEQRNHNISPALKYGKIEVILPPGDANFSVSDTDKRLVDGLANFTSEDYLLLTGDPVAIFIAGAILQTADASLDRVKLLKWDRQTSSYLVIEFQL